MRAVTFQSATAYLLDDPPDWARPVALRAAFPGQVERGLTQREARVPHATIYRLSCRYTSLIGLPEGTDLPTLRNSLQALTTEPILFPCWPSPFAAGATPQMIASYYYVPDHPTNVIQAGAGLPFAYEAYPLMVGLLSQPPDLVLLDDETAQVRFEFEEAADYFLVPFTYTPPAGLEDGGGTTRALWPFRPNWSTPPRAAAPSVELERTPLGQRRQPAEAFYTQPSRRQVDHEFTLTDSEPWQLLRLYLDLGGAQQPVWLPGALAPTRLTADVGSADTTLTVADSSQVGTEDFLLLDDLEHRTPVAVASLPSGTSIALTGAVGQAYGYQTTRLESLILARIQRPELELAFESPTLATARIAFVEVPWEQDTSSGETFGATLGALNSASYLYVFTIPYPGAPQITRLTCWETGLTYGGNTYTSQPIEHDSIRETASLERQETTLNARYWSGNPLALLLPMRLEMPLHVEIFECTAESGTATNVVRVFKGEIGQAEYDGPFIRATARSLPSLLARKIPRQILQPTCNWTLFEARCGLTLAAWLWEGEFNAWTSGLTFQAKSVAAGGSNPHSLAEHDLAGGYLILDTGADAQWRLIADNSAVSGGFMNVRITQPFVPDATTGTALALYPGCNGHYTRCVDFFANGLNFGGFPFMPIGNPTFAKISKTGGTGGKK